MILNGDNKKVFIKDDKIYRIGECCVFEYSRDEVVELRRREFHKIRSVKEFDGKYYLHTEDRKLHVYEDLFGDPTSEVEIHSGGIFDFHIYYGRIFYLRRKMNRCLGFDEDHNLLFDFQMGSYVWEGASFYICHNRSLIKFDLVKKTSESVLNGVNVRKLAVKNGMIAYADDGNILHFLDGSKRLSFHYHAHGVVGIIITALGSLFVICKDGRLVRIETKRNEKMLLCEFYGDALDFVEDGAYVYVLTVFEMLVYDMKAGDVKKRIFSLPDFEYYKPFRYAVEEDEDASEKDILEKNVKKTKVKIPYIFEKQESGRIADNSIVVVRREYVFIYDLMKREIEKTAYFKDSQCFYSSGHIFTFLGRRQRKTIMKIHRIGDDGMSLIKREDFADTINIPEDVIFDNGRVFLYSNELLLELTVSGILKQMKNIDIRQIEETRSGVYVLDSHGIYKIDSRERILEDEQISSFRILDNVLYVSLFGAGVFKFVMRDGATEERIIDGMNVVDVFVEDDVIITSNLLEGNIFLKRYVLHEEGWMKDGEVAVERGAGKVLYKDMYLSVKNKLHSLTF